MEGYPAWEPTPTGYFNNTTPFFYPRPEITGNVLTLNQVYVTPQGSDDVANNGVITSPFATMSGAIYYIENVLDQPLTTPVCIFVAPGTYEGGFTLPDKVYLIGPSNSPQPVVITGNVFAIPSATSGTIGLQNLTLQGVTVGGAFFDANVEIRNCTIETNTIFSALSIAPESGAINASVTATECIFNATDSTNVALISANTSELTSLVLDNCQLTTAGVEGSLIDMTGNLTVRNSSLLNTAAGATLAPLIIAQSGATLTPVVSLEGSVLKYESLTTDTGGDKLAIRFNAPTQPITARMTNCTLSIQLGGGATDIVKNIGAQNVTLTQSANSCLKDGKTIDATNMVLTAAHFLNDSPLPPGPGAGVESLNTLTGDITISGENGVSVGAAGSTITISGSGVASLAGLTGAVTLSSPDSSIVIDVAAQDIQFSSAGVTSATAGDGIQIEGSTSITITNTGVLSVAGLTGAVTLSSPASTIAIAVDGQDITLESNGLLSASAGDGISITGTQDLTIANTGVISVAALTGDITLSGTGVSIDASGGDIAFTVSFPVESVGGKTGAVTFAAGDGIDISGGATNADPITISNTGLLSATAGDGISVGTIDGVVDISNTGVISVAALTGDLTLSGTNVTIDASGSNIDFAVSFPVESVGGKTGTPTFAAGDGIDISGGATNADPITISSTVIGIVASGTVSQADFTEQTTGPATGQYYKAITVGGMNANGIVVATTSGTPAVCSSAWITTVIPTTDTLTFWVAANPVSSGETWEAHYIIQSFGTAPPP